MYEDIFAKSGNLGQWLVITSHNLLWDVLSYACYKYLLLAKRPYIWYNVDPLLWQISFDVLRYLTEMCHETTLICAINTPLIITTPIEPPLIYHYTYWTGYSKVLTLLPHQYINRTSKITENNILIFTRVITHRYQLRRIQLFFDVYQLC